MVLIGKVLQGAEQTFRRLINAPELLPLVYAGIPFADGMQKPVRPKEAAACFHLHVSWQDIPLLPAMAQDMISRLSLS